MCVLVVPAFFPAIKVDRAREPTCESGDSREGRRKRKTRKARFKGQLGEKLGKDLRVRTHSTLSERLRKRLTVWWTRDSFRAKKGLSEG